MHARASSFALGETAWRLAAVVGDHLAEGAGEIGRGPAFSTVQLEVGAMEVSYHPFGIEETGELAQVKLACGLKRRQAGRLRLRGGALHEAQVGQLVVDDLGAADRAVAGDERPNPPRQGG